MRRSSVETLSPRSYCFSSFDRASASVWPRWSSAMGSTRTGSIRSAGIGLGDEAHFARSRCKVLMGKHLPSRLWENGRHKGARRIDNRLRVVRSGHVPSLRSPYGINHFRTTKPARRQHSKVAKRLESAHSEPKRTAHLRHTLWDELQHDTRINAWPTARYGRQPSQP